MKRCSRWQLNLLALGFLGRAWLILFAGGAEAAFAAFGIAQVFRPNVITHRGLFDDQLGDAVSSVEMDRFLAEVDQRHFHFRAIIRVNYAGQHINAVLDRQAGAGRDAAIKAGGNLNRQAGWHQFALARFEREGFNTIQVRASGNCRSALRQLRGGMKFFDFDGGELIGVEWHGCSVI